MKTRAKSQMDMCSNCGVTFLNTTECFNEFRTVTGNTERSVGAGHALATVFESAIPHKQKHIVSKLKVEMCFQCISILAELFRFYTEFTEMNGDGTYVRSLIDKSVTWPMRRSMTTKPEPDLPDPDSDSHEQSFPELVDNSDHDYSEEEITGDVEVEEFKYFPEDQLEPDPIDDPLSIESTPDISTDIDRITRSMRAQADAVLLKDTSLEVTRSDIRRKRKIPKSLKSVNKKITQMAEKHLRCLQCRQKFKTQAKLEAHYQKTSHFRDLVCQKCNPEKVFTIATNLRRHLKEVHQIGQSTDNLANRTCTICLKICPSKSRMKLHSETVHIESKEFQCTQCDKAFSTELYLSRHFLYSHTAEGKRRHPCPHCDLSFATRGGMGRHVKLIHVEDSKKRRFVCEECGKTFSRPEHLRGHLKTHENRTKSCICPTCNVGFYNKNQLRNHMITHKGTKEFLCTYCGDAFLVRSSLQRHVETVHADEDPAANSHHNFPCSTCGKIFKRKDYLAQHLRSKSHGGAGFRANKRSNQSNQNEHEEVEQT